MNEVEEIQVSHSIKKIDDNKWVLLLHVGDRKVRLVDFKENPPVSQVKAVLDITRTCFGIFNNIGSK